MIPGAKKIIAVVGLAAVGAVTLAAVPAFACGPEHGPRGHVMEHGHGHGHKHKHGHDHGFRQRATPLSTAQVKDILEGRIAWRGEDLTVSSVTEKDENTILAEVSKPSGEVVRKVEVDRKTGRFTPLR